MRRILLVLTVMAVMVAMILVVAAPAFAAKGGVPGPEQVNTHENPFADGHNYGSDAKGGQCIFTYTGPSSPPGDEASGGNLGWEFNKSAGAGC
jgi:ABC-type sugar transport system substrate-binding protein